MHPKAYATELGVQAGSEMEVNIDAGALRAEPAPEMQLDALLSQITDATNPAKRTGASPGESRHGEHPKAGGFDLERDGSKQGVGLQSSCPQRPTTEKQDSP